MIQRENIDPKKLNSFEVKQLLVRIKEYCLEVKKIVPRNATQELIKSWSDTGGSYRSWVDEVHATTRDNAERKEKETGFAPSLGNTQPEPVKAPVDAPKPAPAPVAEAKPQIAVSPVLFGTNVRILQDGKLRNVPSIIISIRSDGVYNLFTTRGKIVRMILPYVQFNPRPMTDGERIELAYNLKRKSNQVEALIKNPDDDSTV